MSLDQPYRIVIIGGGTGGHIFPAIAIASQFKERYPSAHILFVGAKGKMEMIKVPQAGFKIIGLWINGLHRKKIWSNLLLPLQFIFSLIKAKYILAHFKPNIIVGTGGYASGPIMIVANKNKTPILIQEQNSYAGLTNKWIAKKANTICVAYPHMHHYFPPHKIIYTGNPIHKNLFDLHEKKQKGLDYFSLDSTHQTLLIIGGSLGAKTINDSILVGLDKLIEAQVQVLWQTGKIYYDDIKEKTAKKNLKKIKFYEFIQRIDLAYAVSSVVVSRSGALTISELCIAQKATILVPSPNVAEDHQTKNAHVLKNKKAAIVITDCNARNVLVNEAIQLLENDKKIKCLSQNIGQLKKPNATQDIVDEIENLIR